ncbi:uncharacterized protein LOC129761253 [Toxorhynchites rutilus septentrionalis]|uniref:uncharacterized protein LOC129761253 n=1 Tax=Toxorhynchites rutilus septentrionalis TaxID=329112 RepID=UPI0024793142|nr:uncharacterized protein LOC129761253 [Toxorhynchites rutilus septentrionalis]
MKKERIPPLFTSRKDVNNLKTELTQQNIQPRFKLCSVGTKIVCSSMQEYTKVGFFLKSEGVEFFTHDLQSAKPLMVVLRGLPPSEATDVQSELMQRGLKPMAVYPMTRRESTNQSCRDQLFLVHFVKGSTSIGALKEIQDMFQVIITWERYRPQHRDVTQCLNCLWFGHGTKTAI